MEEITLPLQCVKKVIGLERVDSTQDLARLLAQKGEAEGTLVLACEQTAARRLDGSRCAAGEGGVYFTLILRPEKKDLCARSLTRQTVQAVAEALAEAYGIKTKIHQPNRVLAWDGKARQWKEIAAVLTETFFDEEARFALVGVGINVNNRGARRETDVSLKHLIGTQTSKEILLGEVLNRFWQHYAQWLQSAC